MTRGGAFSLQIESERCGIDVEKSLRVAALQINGFSFDDRDECRAHIFEMILKALKHNPDIVLLPECSYPSYCLRQWNEHIEKEIESILDELSNVAKGNDVYIACGLPEVVLDEREASTENVIFNSLYVVDHTGEITAIGRKRFLWHFDSDWFVPGTMSTVFDTKWGRIGLMVCADGRDPEILQSLRLQGCKMILNSTNWVCNGRDRDKLSNPQADYLMSVRARETGSWIVAANKVGIEDGFIVYCGNSMVVNPEGQVVARAGSRLPDVIIYDIPLNDTSNEILCGDDGLDDVPMHQPFTMINLNENAGKMELKTADYIYIAAAQTGINCRKCRIEDVVSKVDIMCLRAKTCKADMLILDVDLRHVDEYEDEPDISYHNLAMSIVDKMTCCPVDTLLHMKFDSSTAFDVFICSNTDCNVTLLTCPIILQTDKFRFGVIDGSQFLNYDLSRTMMIAGAQLVVWMCDGSDQDYVAFARTRAMENRIYTVCMNGCAKREHAEPNDRGYNSLICDPDGKIIAETFEDTEQMICTYLDLSVTERKTVVPGTNVKKEAFSFRQV